MNLYLSAIYNYDGHSQYDLQLAVGDTVQIKEYLSGNVTSRAWLLLIYLSAIASIAAAEAAVSVVLRSSCLAKIA